MSSQPSIAEGERVRLVKPNLRMQEEFLAAVLESRSLHAPWVSAPSDPTSYRAYVYRLGKRDQVGFAVRRRDDETLVGIINVNNLVFGSFWSGYLGYYAFAAGAGQGLMTEGLGLVAAHAFGELGLHRLEANIQPGNHRSIALVERLGFRLEGLSPRYLFIDGAWRDHERWALTDDSATADPA